jgi:hypothetical protein
LKLVDQDERLHDDRVGSIAPLLVSEQLQLQEERDQPAVRLDGALLHEERLHDERV